MPVVKQSLGRHWTRLPLRIRGVAALSLPIAALIVNSSLVLPLFSAQQTASDWVAHTFQVRIELEHIVAELSNVTVNYRMYRLNRDRNALRSAELASSAVTAGVDRIQALTADNIRQQIRLPELRVAVERRIQFLREIALNPSAFSTDREIVSQSMRQSLIGLLHRMDREEQSLLNTRQATQKSANTLQIIAGIGSLFIGIVSGAAGIFWFLQTETGIRHVTEGLEEHVEERTRQLAEANRELEAFSSAVSHDLRAPLRSVDGFARILLRDYTGILDEKGQDMVRRMRAASLRMAQLIEDLLKLSRISRSEVVRQSSDLSALAAAVCDDLRAGQPGRAIDIEIEPGLKAGADARLTRIVLENLLGNAWKFTRNVQSAQIAFGAVPSAEQTACYYVRDNGAGFDMASAGQLFTPFQRLHSAAQFEGSGVGLATVQRVIHRHRGRIWAESSPGRGATFFFTLDDHSAPKG